jgi:hypothetical protein
MNVSRAKVFELQQSDVGNENSMWLSGYSWLEGGG